MDFDIGAVRKLVEAGQYQEALRLLEYPLGEDASVDALRLAATALQKLGQYQEATLVVGRILIHERNANNRAGEKAALLRQAGLFIALKNFETAGDALVEGLELCVVDSDRSGEAQMLHKLGDLGLHQRDDVKAREYFERCQGIRRSIGEDQSEAFFSVEDRLATIALKQRRYEAARVGYQERLRRLAGANDPQNVARALHSLGIIEVATGHPGDAQSALRGSLTIWRELGVWDQQARVLALLAGVSIGDGDVKSGSHLIEQALDAVERVNSNAQCRREVLEGLCGLAVRQKNIEGALTIVLLMEREMEDQEATRDVNRFLRQWPVAESTLARIRSDVVREHSVDGGRRMVRILLAVLAS